jgi:CspA family cold shock protein
MEKFSGKIKWFNATKGYGFIVPDNGGKEVFVHISAFQNAGIAANNIEPNQKVKYTVATRKGKESVDIIELVSE